ncbi:MAG: hypothetical protein HN976_07945 [Lentisphaerae bacterium]|nr:hypothetical protein [Lentisphaerota bacterium]
MALTCRAAKRGKHRSFRSAAMLIGPFLFFLMALLIPALTQPVCINTVFGALIAYSFMAYMGYLNLQERRPANMVIGILSIALYVIVVLPGLIRGIDHTFGMGPR